MLLPEFLVKKGDEPTSNLDGLLTTGCLESDGVCRHLHIKGQTSFMIPLSAPGWRLSIKGMIRIPLALLCWPCRMGFNWSANIFGCSRP